MAQLHEEHPDPLVSTNGIIPIVSSMVAGIIHRAMSISSDVRIPTAEQLLGALWELSTLPPRRSGFPVTVPAASAESAVSTYDN